MAEVRVHARRQGINGLSVERRRTFVLQRAQAIERSQGEIFNHVTNQDHI